VTDPRDTVRRGYDALSYRYRADDATDEGYEDWLTRLGKQVPTGGAVLDLGCGNGIPVSRWLVGHGYAVTGVDISDVQIDRARALVPTAHFRRADATGVEFPDASFDAVVSLFALIHLPLDMQPVLLRRIAHWLRPSGVFLATTGYSAWTGAEDGWLGGEATMWWSHTDAATYRKWLTEAGFTIDTEEFKAEGDSGHAVFWAHRS
jgi:SAM-dependent methyltransferase